MAYPLPRLPTEIDTYTGSEPETPAAVAEVDRLEVTFRRGGREIRAVRGVSLDIQPGEILGLVGESGSGKSVLGMSLLGLLPADAKTSSEPSSRTR
jgi:peptide/nickel transport system ATP-binding protein